MQGILHSMFHLPLPILEKIVRPIIVYLCLILFLRLFGKRELAQLNPFDLVVLLSLSNTVQNSIIGDDNSVSGGVIGAFSLLAINWLLMKALYRAPKLNAALEGRESILIRNGLVDERALREETLTHEELIQILNRNGFNDPMDIEICKLEPNGTFYVKGKSPTAEHVEMHEVLDSLHRLREEVARLREELQLRKAE
ncbi:MAG TPA: YetF domain-containing protein [Acidobacteriaceae bacterium]